MRIVRPFPMACARSRPMATLSTSSAVSPNLSCESQTGTSWPILAHMCKSGLSFCVVTLNGITLGEQDLHHRMNVRARFIETAVDEPFEIRRPPARIDGIAFEREFHDVVSLDAIGRPGARQQKALRVADGARRLCSNSSTDAPAASTHAVCGDEFFDQVIQLCHRRFLYLSSREVPAHVGRGVHARLAGVVRGHLRMRGRRSAGVLLAR